MIFFEILIRALKIEMNLFDVFILKNTSINAPASLEPYHGLLELVLAAQLFKGIESPRSTGSLVRKDLVRSLRGRFPSLLASYH